MKKQLKHIVVDGNKRREYIGFCPLLGHHVGEILAADHSHNYQVVIAIVEDSQELWLVDTAEHGSACSLSEVILGYYKDEQVKPWTIFTLVSVEDFIWP